MKLFLDTANIKEIKKGVEAGIIDGVTTNPTLISQEGSVDFAKHIRRICNLTEGPVNAEVISTKSEEMINEARELAGLASNVVVKIPMIKEGLKAVKVLSEEEIKTNVTLVFSANQALLAAKAGANYVSPFIGRLDDRSHEGLKLVAALRTIFDNYNFNTKIIVASIRSPLHVKKAAIKGADIATLPAEVLEKMFGHPLTDMGLERFLKDWEKLEKNDF